jgi:prepilin-type N-terminal cleavage/methylation domain-containing protein
MIAIAPSRPRHTEHGFTLIEVLAALAIGSAVIAATVTLIHNVALSFDRGTALAGKADQLLLATERLAADFRSARPAQRSSGANAAVAFVGEPSQVKFIAAGGAASSQQGEEVITLTVEDIEGASHLVRRRARWLGPRAPFESVGVGDPVDLMEGLVDIVFAFGSVAADGNLTWSDSWSGRPLLPRLVRLTVRDRASGAELLPSMQFTLRADAPLTCARPGAKTSCLTGERTAPGAPANDVSKDKSEPSEDTKDTPQDRPT